MATAGAYAPVNMACFLFVILHPFNTKSEQQNKSEVFVFFLILLSVGSHMKIFPFNKDN